MKFWLYDSFEIETSITLEEIVTKLEAETEPEKLFPSVFGKHRTFQGKVSQEGFKIMRRSLHGNDLLAVVCGSYKPGPSGVTVLVKMRPSIIVIIFMCLACAIMIGSRESFVELLNPGYLGILMIVMVIMHLVFWSEAEKQKQMLINILK